MMLYLILALLLSFATVNATLVTPALPALAALFHVSEAQMEAAVLLFLVGYCFGQLLYSPLENRFGRKPALFVGIILQIVSSLLAVVAGYLLYFKLFLLSRFLLALGSGVGLMMTFAIVGEQYPKDKVRTIISYLIPSFAVVPAIGVLLSGYLSNMCCWSASFYLGAGYGVFMVLLCTFLPPSQQKPDLDALHISKITRVFSEQLRRKAVVISGMLMGCCVAFVYIFSTIAPFFTAKYFHMDSEAYALANAFSALGLVSGAVIEPQLPQRLSSLKVIRMGLVIIMFASIAILIGEYFVFPAFPTFFIPAFLINLGSCFILAHASSMVLDQTQEKTHASAVMNFINVGTTTVIMLIFSYLPLGHFLLACTFIGLCLVMMLLTSA